MTEDTLEAFFKRAKTEGVIDFYLRIGVAKGGHLGFYIHPQNRDGETGDFTVSGSSVKKIDNNGQDNPGND